MALDEANHRLFVGCRIPSKLVCDDVLYDGKRHRIYAICGAGKIDIIEQTDPTSYKASSKIETADGARTGFFVSERDTLFVAVPHRGSQVAEIRCYHVR